MRVSSAINPDDSPIIDVMHSRVGLPVKVRIQPAILRKAEKRPTQASYQPWPGLSWVIEMPTLDEVRALREALTTFFWIASRDGIDAVRDRLAAGLPREG